MQTVRRSEKNLRAARTEFHTERGFNDITECTGGRRAKRRIARVSESARAFRSVPSSVLVPFWTTYRLKMAFGLDCISRHSSA